jgi:hypothetical protein
MLYYNPNKEKRQQMTVNGYTYKVGDLFTTLKSKKTGVIKEIHPQTSGSVRVLLELPTKETRWTSVSAQTLLGV